MEKYNLSGVSISLLDRTRQLVKFSIGLADMMTISRNVSIDGHAILSSDIFILLDASRDWRMIYNPLVHGPPFIKFYASVPLRSNKNPQLAIGCVSVFDPYIRNHVSADFKNSLYELSAKIMEFIEAKPSILSPRIESSSAEQSATTGVETTSPNNSAKFGADSAAIGRILPVEYGVGCDRNTLSDLNYNPSVIQSYRIAKKLMECDTASDAVEKACRILSDALGLDSVYVLEIRITSVYHVPAVKYHFHQGALCTEVENLNELLGTEKDKNVHMRLLGGHGIPENTRNFDAEVHSLALESNYGIKYDAPSESLSYRSGIFMSFHKAPSRLLSGPLSPITASDHSVNSDNTNHPTKSSGSTNLSAEGLARYGLFNKSSISSEPVNFSGFGAKTKNRSQVSTSPETPNSTNTKDSKGKDTPGILSNMGLDTNGSSTFTPSTTEISCPMVRVKKRHGGYIMAGFSLAHRAFSPSDVEYMNLCVKALNSIFACDEC